MISVGVSSFVAYKEAGETELPQIVLIIDNKLNNKVIKRLLERYNFKVVTVSSGQECIYKVKSEEHFDIIFNIIITERHSKADLVWLHVKRHPFGTQSMKRYPIGVKIGVKCTICECSSTA